MPAFDRAVPALGSSLARWRHRKDQSELNGRFWVAVLERDMLVQRTKLINDSDGPPEVALTIKTDAAGKVGHNIGELRRRINVSYSWERLFTLLMAVSALERYMLAAATAAIESDPLTTPGFPKLIDGLLLKKRDLNIPKPLLTPIVKGDWAGRIAALERLFGSVPQELKTAQGELEKIRRMRNSIAHSFGEDETNSVLPPSVSLIVGARVDRLGQPRQGLSAKRLVSWLGLLNEISKALDKQLTEQYIGDYEMVAIYLDWQRSPDRYEAAFGIKLVSQKRSFEQRFTNFISAALGWALGHDYFHTMETFVRRL